MPLLLNIRDLEHGALEFSGEVPAFELDLDGDELIHAQEPAVFELEAQLSEGAILVKGRVEMLLNCECARCLKKFQRPLCLEEWALLLPLEGEDKVSTEGDVVDLTPYLREDILLSYSQHPLCDAECRGLAQVSHGESGKGSNGSHGTGQQGSVWDELGKLKF